MTLKRIKELKAALKIVADALEKERVNLRFENFGDVQVLGGSHPLLRISRINGEELAKQLKPALILSEFTHGDERIYRRKDGSCWIRLQAQADNRWAAKTNDSDLYEKYHYKDGNCQKLRLKCFESFGFPTKQEAQADLDQFAEKYDLEIITNAEYEKHYR
jgi:hypothetical protein